MQRYSRKRERILECLISTKEHPSAEWVYSKVKDEFPSLSFATVYRNLKNLKEEGIIRSVGVVDGHERFDADVTPHTHLVCIKCGKIADDDYNAAAENISDVLFEKIGFTVIRAEMTVSGICAECMEDQNG